METLKQSTSKLYLQYLSKGSGFLALKILGPGFGLLFVLGPTFFFLFYSENWWSENRNTRTVYRAELPLFMHLVIQEIVW